MTSSKKVNWGIVGASRIASRLLRDVAGSRNVAVTAVASRDRARAEEFAGRHGIGRVYDSYDALLADPEVDAVYIGLPNSLHHPMTMRSLAAGKHVLCEKPYSRHPADVDEGFDLAADKGLILMEAFMWRHAPRVKRFLELLPEVGELVSIRSSFSFVLEATRDVRLDPDLDGGGLMDVGCYTISGSRLVAGADPSWVFGHETLGPSGVDLSFSGLLRFPSGVVAEIVSGFTSTHRSLEAIGSRGNLLLLDPWLGELGGIRLGDREIDVTASPEQDQYRLEMENVSSAILGEVRPLLGRDDALGQARTIEALYRSAATGEPVTLDS